MQLGSSSVPHLIGANDPAIAFVPWHFTPGSGVPFGRAFGAVDLDSLNWPLGRPDRPIRKVADLQAGDQLIFWALKHARLLFDPRRGTRAGLNPVLHEPKPIAGRNYWKFRLMSHRLNSLLMNDVAGFGPSKVTEFLPCGTTWIPHWRDLEIDKTHDLSLIASSRRDLPGHKLRHEVAQFLSEERPDAALMGRGYAPFEAKEDGLAPFRFSIIIENVRQPHYFSEKIVDALLCETVPIYWGDPKIADYFDTQALIVCESLEEIQCAVKSIGPELYAKMLPKLRAEKQKAAYYADMEARAAVAVYRRMTKGN